MKLKFCSSPAASQGRWRRSQLQQQLQLMLFMHQNAQQAADATMVHPACRAAPYVGPCLCKDWQELQGCLQPPMTPLRDTFPPTPATCTIPPAVPLEPTAEPESDDTPDELPWFHCPTRARKEPGAAAEKDSFKRSLYNCSETWSVLGFTCSV